METITAMARNVVMIIFLAAVLDMMLPPKSSLGRYLQLVMGLFMVVSILSPVLDWLNKSSELETLAIFSQEQTGSQKTILQKGEEMLEENQRLAAETAITRMKKQIEALTKLIPGVGEARVQISVDNNFIETGIIKQVKIEAWREKKQQEKTTGIEPVKVSLTNTSKESAPEIDAGLLERRIKETVGNFFSLNPEQIEIVIN